jgi:hypothetical protein
MYMCVCVCVVFGTEKYMMIIYPDVVWPHLNLVPRSCSHPIAAFAVRLVPGWIRKWADGGWVGGRRRNGENGFGKRKKSNQINCAFRCVVCREWIIFFSCWLSFVGQVGLVHIRSTVADCTKLLRVFEPPNMRTIARACKDTPPPFLPWLPRTSIRFSRLSSCLTYNTKCNFKKNLWLDEIGH